MKPLGCIDIAKRMISTAMSPSNAARNVKHSGTRVMQEKQGISGGRSWFPFHTEERGPLESFGFVIQTT